MTTEHDKVLRELTSQLFDLAGETPDKRLKRRLLDEGRKLMAERDEADACTRLRNLIVMAEKELQQTRMERVRRRRILSCTQQPCVADHLDAAIRDVRDWLIAHGIPEDVVNRLNAEELYQTIHREVTK